MKNKHHINYSYVVLPLALIIAISVLVILKEYNVIEHKQKYVLKMPPEFFDNHTLAIGDEFEKISRFFSLEQHWYFDGLSKEKHYTSGYYFSEIASFRFNRLGRVESVVTTVSNSDSLTWLDFMKRNSKIMVLHYGKNYTIYRLLKSESDCCIEWNLPDDITVSMSFNMSDSSRLTHEHIVSFDFNTGIPLKNQYVYFTKNETLENLGFE